MKKLTKLPAAVLCAVLIVSMLAACSAPSGNNDDSSAAAPSENNADSSAAAPGASEPSSDGKVTVTIGHITELTDLDRFANYGSGGDDTGLLWADPLIFSNHLGTYTPALALEWSVSDDYLAYTFKLREGVKFHDGSEFTSFDVKRTFERMFEDETLVDVNAWGSFDSIETPDNYTAIIHLKDIMPTFYDELGRVPIICGAAYDADQENYFQLPAGTGSYTVASFDRLTSLVIFNRNDDWWGWSELGKSSNVDEIVYEYINDSTVRVSALQAGNIDIAFQLTLDNLTLLDKEKFEVLEVDSDSHIHLALQCAEGKPFNDKNLREALSLSIDRQAIVDSILGGGTASTWVVPKSNIGYVAGKPYEYNVERAKELIAQSTYSGEELKLMINTGTTGFSEVCQVIKAQAAQAGINITLEPIEYATFVDRRDSGDFDFFFSSFAATCGDPQVEISVIMSFNIFNTNYDNAELSALTNATRSISDKAERAKVMEQAFTIEMEEFAPFIYVYDESYCYASAKNVTGYTVFADGSGDYRFMNVN